MVEVIDNSTNNFWLWPFILGDAWHNNHHANADKTTTQIKKYEFWNLNYSKAVLNPAAELTDKK